MRGFQPPLTRGARESAGHVRARGGQLRSATLLVRSAGGGGLRGHEQGGSDPVKLHLWYSWRVVAYQLGGGRNDF